MENEIIYFEKPGRVNTAASKSFPDLKVLKILAKPKA